MYEQGERAYDENTKQAIVPLREDLDRAVQRLHKEFDALAERIAPILAPDVPHDGVVGLRPYQSPLGNQVAALHELASRMANLSGRIEL